MGIQFSAYSHTSAYRPAAAGPQKTRFGNASSTEDILDRAPYQFDKTPRQILGGIKTQLKDAQTELDKTYNRAVAEYPARLEEYKRLREKWDNKLVKWFQSPPVRPEEPRREEAAVDIEKLYWDMGIDINSAEQVQAMDNIFGTLIQENLLSVEATRQVTDSGMTRKVMFEKYRMTLTEEGKKFKCA